MSFSFFLRAYRSARIRSFSSACSLMRDLRISSVSTAAAYLSARSLAWRMSSKRLRSSSRLRTSSISLRRTSLAASRASKSSRFFRSTASFICSAPARVG